MTRNFGRKLDAPLCSFHLALNATNNNKITINKKTKQKQNTIETPPHFPIVIINISYTALTYSFPTTILTLQPLKLIASTKNTMHPSTLLQNITADPNDHS